jgi:hypothetical protein
LTRSRDRSLVKADGCFGRDHRRAGRVASPVSHVIMLTGPRSRETSGVPPSLESVFLYRGNKTPYAHALLT